MFSLFRACRRAGTNRFDWCCPEGKTQGEAHNWSCHCARKMPNIFGGVNVQHAPNVRFKLVSPSSTYVFLPLTFLLFCVSFFVIWNFRFPRVYPGRCTRCCCRGLLLPGIVYCQNALHTNEQGKYNLTQNRTLSDVHWEKCALEFIGKTLNMRWV